MTPDELARLATDIAWLKDRQMILDCIVRESRARDRQDVDAIEACWWPEGVDEHGAVVTVATEYARRANAGHRAVFRSTSHNITNHVCDLDGDTANCETYVVGALAWKGSDKVSLGVGRYLDRLEKRDGEWRILVRRCTIESTLDGDGSWVHSDAVKGFLQPLFDGNDPSYEKPYEWQPREVGVRW